MQDARKPTRACTLIQIIVMDLFNAMMEAKYSTRIVILDLNGMMQSKIVMNHVVLLAVVVFNTTRSSSFL